MPAPAFLMRSLSRVKRRCVDGRRGAVARGQNAWLASGKQTAAIAIITEEPFIVAAAVAVQAGRGGGGDGVGGRGVGIMCYRMWLWSASAGAVMFLHILESIRFMAGKDSLLPSAV